MKYIRTKNGVERLTEEAAEALKPVPTIEELRKARYEAEYSTGDVKDIIMKQFNYMRLNGVDLIQEADDWVGSCLAVKRDIPKLEEVIEEPEIILEPEVIEE
jgi:hypothetical protein